MKNRKWALLANAGLQTINIAGFPKHTSKWFPVQSVASPNALVSMKAIILCGGFGKRLLPLTYRVSKVMVPIAGKPVLQHLIEICRNAGVHEIIISLNSMQKAIEEHFGAGQKLGIKLTYVYEDSMREQEKLGAVAAIHYALSQVAGDGKAGGDWIIMGGDNVFYGLDLKKLSRKHSSSSAFATLALYRLKDKADCEQYGVVEVDSRGRILQMQEKPKLAEAVSDVACTAVYHVGEAFLREYLPKYVEEAQKKEKKPDRLGDLWAHYAKEVPLYGHAFEGLWGDANSPKTYVETNKQAMRFVVGSAAGITCRVEDGSCSAISTKAQIHEDALIKGPCIIEEGCVIGRGAIVGRGTHLMKGCFVGENASVHASIVFEKCFIGSNARLTECVVDAGSRIASGAVVEPYAVLGFKSKLGSNARILEECRVWPFVEIGDNAIIGGDVMLDEKLFEGKLHL